MLDGLGIRWCLGGSLGAALYGVARATRDLDVVVDFGADQLEPLFAALAKRFYVSRPAMIEALRDRRSFNAVDAESGFKVDFFVAGTTAFDRQELDGRRMLPLPDADGLQVPAKSLEDSILRKLLWYRDGGAVSDLQWGDVLALIRTNASRLNQPYLDQWAATLGLGPLLSRARDEASL